jgi:hypothetical protein
MINNNVMKEKIILNLLITNNFKNVQSIGFLNRGSVKSQNLSGTGSFDRITFF